MSAPIQTRRLAGAVLVIAAALAADQLSKRWAVAELHGHPRRILIRGLFEFDFAFNTGSAFGLFATIPDARWVLIATTVLGLLTMALLTWRLPGRPRSARAAWVGTIGLALMTGGALGNLGDRLLREIDVRIRIVKEVPFWLVVEHPQAYAAAVLRPRSFVDVPRHGVVDFIVVYYRPGMRWPAFNLADTWLVLGVGLLLVYMARNGGFRKQAPTGP